MHPGAVKKIDFINRNMHRSEHHLVMSGQYKSYQVCSNNGYVAKMAYIVKAQKIFISETTKHRALIF